MFFYIIISFALHKGMCVFCIIMQFTLHSYIMKIMGNLPPGNDNDLNDSQFYNRIEKKFPLLMIIWN